MTNFDPTKPVKTRDGHSARIIYTDAVGPYPIVALVCNNDGEFASSLTKEGRWRIDCDEDNSRDLVNIPEKHEAWINIYPRGGASSHPSKDCADEFAVRGRIACIKITFTDGEGL